MKTKTEKKEVESTIYICEECGKEDYEKVNIEICEDQHKCKHEELSHNVDGHSDYEGYFENAYIFRICMDCGKDMGSVCLNKEDYDDKVFEEVFNILKKNLKPKTVEEL